MLVTKQIEIDMGHRVPNHKSKCRNLHGHRYKIEVGVDDKVINTKGSSDEGMVIDFGDLKDIMMEEINDKFDHKCVLNEKDEFLDKIGWTPGFRNIEKQYFGFITVDFIPTAENLAKHWYELMQPKLKEKNIAIDYVKVWETPTSTATYDEYEI